MIVPGSQDFTGYIGSTFDTIIIVYPSADTQFNWVGSWTAGVNYSVGTVVVGTDNQAYDALKANVSVSPIGDLTGTWSTPLVPMNLNGWSGYITIADTAADELVVLPRVSTPVQIQGTQGQISVKFTPSQSTTPLIPPANYHHWITMTDPSGNVYYYLNGTFQWLSP